MSIYSQPITTDLDASFIPTIQFLASNVVESIVTIPKPEHNDDYAVLKFSNALREKLTKVREDGRYGWEDPNQCSTMFLRYLLESEMEKPIIDLVDVANYCMMLHQRGVQFLDNVHRSRNDPA
jgi:hypothetical protein